MLKRLTTLATLSLILHLVGCVNSEKEEIKPINGLSNFEQFMNQVEVCYVIGIQSDQFMAFMKEKGIPIASPGGDEFHTITVDEKRVSDFMKIAHTDEVLEQFDIRFTNTTTTSAIQTQ